MRLNPFSSGRSTRRRDTPPPIPTALAGLAVIIALMVLGWQGLRVYNGVPGRDYKTIYISTPEVGNLLTHDQVRIAGARVGQVMTSDLGSDGQPRIELQIEPGTRLPQDTRVNVRAAGLLGARSIELVPGRSEEELPDGATIEGDSGSYTFGLPEALDTFDKETRGALGTMVGGLGQAMLGHGEKVNDGIHFAGTRAKPFGVFAATVLERQGAARRLIPALRSAVEPLDANRRRLADLMGVTADAVEPFVDQREAVRATLDEAPPALAAAQPGLTAGTRLVRSLGGLAEQANRTLPSAPAGLRNLNGLLRQSDEPLDRAAELLKAARPAVPGALRITDGLRPLLEPADGLLDDFPHILGEVERYGCDIINFGTVFRSMTGYTQPGSGPHGPAQAFRLQFVAPLSGDALGIKDDSGFNVRQQVVEPCTLLAKPYPQFAGGTP